uniref:Uncharacterized protein n=1 Tax=Romanomermis culicivorax TaxID=13658 RepID=A0A915K131_ROMCU
DCFECRNCVKLGGQKERTRVKNGGLISNPKAGHNQLCTPIDAIALETLSLSRDMIKLAENGTKPIHPYREGLAEIPNRCADPNFLNQVQLAVPAFQSICSSLYRASAINLIPIPDPNNLPIEYQLTLTGREARARDPNDLNANERFMLADEGGLLIFASN